MFRLTAIASIVIFATSAATVRAGLMSAPSETSTAASFDITGSGLNGPDGWIHSTSHAAGAIVNTVSDSLAGDPTINLAETIFNTSGGDWTGYDITISAISGNITAFFTGATTPVNFLTDTPVLSPLVNSTTIHFSGVGHNTPLPDSNSVVSNYTIQINPTQSGNQSFSYEITETPVPEPATLGILGMGAAALLCRRK